MRWFVRWHVPPLSLNDRLVNQKGNSTFHYRFPFTLQLMLIRSTCGSWGKPDVTVLPKAECQDKKLTLWLWFTYYIAAIDPSVGLCGQTQPLFSVAGPFSLSCTQKIRPKITFCYTTLTLSYVQSDFHEEVTEFLTIGCVLVTSQLSKKPIVSNWAGVQVLQIFQVDLWLISL